MSSSRAPMSSCCSREVSAERCFGDDLADQLERSGGCSSSRGSLAAARGVDTVVERLQHAGHASPAALSLRRSAALRTGVGRRQRSGQPRAPAPVGRGGLAPAGARSAVGPTSGERRPNMRLAPARQPARHEAEPRRSAVVPHSRSTMAAMPAATLPRPPASGWPMFVAAATAPESNGIIRSILRADALLELRRAAISPWRCSPTRLATRFTWQAALIGRQHAGDAQRVAHPGQRQVGDDHEVRCRVQGVAARMRDDARQIDDDVVELGPQLAGDQIEPAGVPQDGLAQRLPRRSARAACPTAGSSPARDRGRRPGSAFSSASRRPWFGSRSSARARLPNCRSRSSAVTRRPRRLAMLQAVLAASIVAPTPPRVPTKATSRPSRRRLAVAPAVPSAAASSDRCSSAGGHRLDDVVGDPTMQQVAEHADIVAVADDDHADAGLADLGQLVDGRQRQSSPETSTTSSRGERARPRAWMACSIPPLTTEACGIISSADDLVDDGTASRRPG